MLRVILAGCHGRMGREVAAHCADRSDVCVVAGLSKNTCPADRFPVFSDFAQCCVSADALIDFSHPEALAPMLAFCSRRKLPAVLAVTGYSQQQLEQIRLVSRSIPIFRATNLSVGANVLRTLSRQAAAALGNNFDITIIERHHKSKVDSPSGTAVMLAKSVPGEADIISIRAGNTTAGEHTVLLTGQNEVLELTHRAYSRSIYAAGAIRAAHFIAKINRPGLYGMEHLLK